MENEKKHLAIFEGKQIRRHWDDQSEKWYFSVVDVVSSLTGSSIPRRYWSDLKISLKNEGSEVYEKIVQLEMLAEDGKIRDTDCADTEIMLRIVQSIPSPNAEPFKLWLAKVGYERLEETADPELAINRVLKTYLSKGEEPKGLEPSRGVAKRGGTIAGNARRQVEKETGKSVVTIDNFKTFKHKSLQNKNK